MENTASFEVRVERYLEDLIPDYLSNRRKEVAQLATAFESGNFDAIAQLTHRMIGVGTPYGFNHVTDVARKLREAALARDETTLSTILTDYRDYVAKIRVIFE